MENYEQKYKDALEKLQEALAPTKDGCKISGLTRDCIENIFPELKDSDDERIRKDIISYLRNEKIVKRYISDIEVDKWIAWLEKQGEQPTDKVEPKFKVGDWLQYRYAEPFLVEEITEQGYCNGNSCLPFEWEDEIHPWTIQDAKDGDIVYYECHGNKHLFIVKSVGETKDHVEGHFWYDITRNEHEVWDGRLPYSNIASMRDAMPATKEQRDLLFAKMKEEGYYWDAKNNTLWKTK